MPLLLLLLLPPRTGAAHGAAVAVRGMRMAAAAAAEPLAKGNRVEDLQHIREEDQPIGPTLLEE